jgi:hypothetical protein
MAHLRVPALIGAAAMVSVLAARPHVSAKLDVTLSTWAKHPTTPFVRTLIHVRPGTVAQIARQLANVSRPLGVESTADSMVADLSPAGLLAANLDSNVVRLSVDSAVKPGIPRPGDHQARTLRVASGIAGPDSEAGLRNVIGELAR